MWRVLLLVLGCCGQVSRVGSINAFELYAEGFIDKHISVRVGRQALTLDNGRIFSVSDSGKVPVWHYLMISYTPQLLHWKQSAE
ncbi:hypothetical protein [Dyadobacter alkalitolerans]|uniref:hypothetical protein n=1 Tax=Dyadobacter alkalitolerans TaxID=492736 RepID=UPI0003FE2DE9|nr:hypothetical protein [Dyadobacter alkalitolerans]